MATTINDIIDGVIEREGGAKVTNDPADHGGRTQYGISERSNPEAWRDGRVTEEEAREIYFSKYIKGPGLIHIEDEHLRAQMADYSVNSGPAVAISKLQAILGVVVDGILGVKTLEALALRQPRDVNNQLVAARMLMICRIVQKVPSQLKYLVGWADRTLSFLK